MAFCFGDLESLMQIKFGCVLVTLELIVFLKNFGFYWAHCKLSMSLQAKGNEGLQATKDAIDAGYRHFDTAYMYGNEAAVGQGIREKIAEGVVKREEIFYVTKLWCTDMEVSRVEQACRRSLINAGLAYIDLYLIHFPVAFANRGDELFPRNADGSLDTL